jgi:4-diphosphocytidyl-2-C-methyl-D-erythritol kinase
VTGRVAFRAFAKINLGLHVGPPRPDGYHEVRTVMQSIALCDLLEVHPSVDLTLTCSDPTLPSGEENLVMKAARALQSAHGCAKGARILLTKRVPAQAGLGGGSSDAAAALVALARLWHLPSSFEDLAPVAAALGADVPFFLLGGTALGVSRGEEIYALPDGPNLHLVLAVPSSGMPTGEAYRRLDALAGAGAGGGEKGPSVRLTPHGGVLRIAALVHALVEGRLSERLLFNDFEAVNLDAGTESAQARSALQGAGAGRIIPAGSGAAWVGFFPDRDIAAAAQRKLVQRGFNAIHTGSITRKLYWEQTVPTWVKE